jgi:type I restriction enzyme S subunit
LKNAKIPNTGYNRHFKWLKEVNVEYPNSERQENVVNILDKVNAIIEIYQRELVQFDELVRARFVEMFGTLGTDEKGWGLTRLGKCCEINPKKNADKRLTSGIKVSFVPMQSVSEDGKIDTSQVKIYDEVKSGFTYFAENDVLFAKITPCMENGKGAVAAKLYNGIGFGSTEFHVLRPRNEICNAYWLYVLTTFKSFRNNAEMNMTGSAGQKRVPPAFLENHKIALPPIELQNQFADFVAEVDKSKVAVQKALDETRILFDSLMQKYFG